MAKRQEIAVSDKPEIDIISASAGSGKTYALMERMFAEIKSGRIRPEEIIAVTYTRKAAGELIVRVRQKLIEEGMADLARGIEAARIGTVHSVCSRFLMEFAYETKSSPDQRVLEDTEGEAIFRRTAKDALSAEEIRALRLAAEHLSLKLDDLLDEARKIAKLARQNDIPAMDVLDGAQASVAQIERAFLTAQTDVENRLTAALEAYVLKQPNVPGDKKDGSATQATQEAHKTVLRFRSYLQNETWKWRDWDGLSSIKPGAKVANLYEDIIEASIRFVAHPEFHADLATVIRSVHTLASRTMNRFEEEKKALGVQDYQDMEHGALKLLDLPEVQKRLGEEIKLLLVDEFQDTNPVQLAIFLKLSRLCGRTVWVGDVKQSIFGFQGADPELMRAVLDRIGGGPAQVLKESRRSRSEISDFTSALFENSLAQDGFSADQVRLKTAAEVKLCNKVPALSVWNLAGGKKEDRWASLAAQLRILLNSRVNVTDRSTGQTRPVQPGDIGILAPVNEWCTEIASALAQSGMRTNISSSLLIDRPEVRLVLGACRYTLNCRDRLAAAEFTVFYGTDPDSWLSAVAAGNKPETWAQPLKRLSSAKDRWKESTPLEFIDAVMAECGIFSMVERWENGIERLASIAELRGMASSYEDACAETMIPCSVAGFLTDLESFKFEEAKPGEDNKGWSRPEAVDIFTYHKSKGLEWPIMILTGLDKNRRNEKVFFGHRVIGPEKKAFDVWNPLAGRSVRYLPWPFSDNRKMDVIVQRQTTDPEAAAWVKQRAGEERRKFYVAFTRARESLILAVADPAKVNDKCAGILCDETGKAVIDWKTDENELVIAGKSFSCTVASCAPQELIPGAKIDQTVLPVPEPAIGKRAMLNATPSALVLSPEDEGRISLGEVIELGKPFKLEGDNSEEMLGNAVHAFLAVDESTLTVPERISLAETVLNRWGVAGAIDPANLVEMADRLERVIKERWPRAAKEREYPLKIRVGDKTCPTTLTGNIDLLIRHNEQAIIIDHKTTAIGKAGLLLRARAHAAQLATYALAVSKALEIAKVSIWLHFPLSGVLVEVRIYESERLLSSISAVISEAPVA